ncbi:hypothetical protein DFJ58DRAFT_861776 [Suillus subalutaceus]|uniref:uncharacterized protein n=1 Tax=Suillus subalutaceus TaxID=48586 RepID=UPI001B880014|nr:uncharacterized protein DFJ58DRAFT_861776 [Suillus subalutaceus]KAG1838199.1 hypothetical protein DFJ58DRAFT_861776 [Suillus subalutaceus]
MYNIWATKFHTRALTIAVLDFVPDWVARRATMEFNPALADAESVRQTITAGCPLVNLRLPALSQQPTTTTTPHFFDGKLDIDSWTHQCRGQSFFNAGSVEEMPLKAGAQTVCCSPAYFSPSAHPPAHLSHPPNPTTPDCAQLLPLAPLPYALTVSVMMTLPLRSCVLLPFESICTAILIVVASAVHVMRISATYHHIQNVRATMWGLYAVQIVVAAICCGFYCSVHLQDGQGCIIGPLDNASWVGIHWLAPTWLYGTSFVLAALLSIKTLEIKPVSYWRLMLRDGLNLMAAVLAMMMSMRIILSVRGDLVNGGSFSVSSHTASSGANTNPLSGSDMRPRGGNHTFRLSRCRQVDRKELVCSLAGFHL